MKLSRIYSNKIEFKPIDFNEGFNVIYGDVENLNIDNNTGKVQEHNIGKSSLVHLIDFLLLKGFNKNTFFGKHIDKFSDWIFFLEVKLNSGEYLTIRRSIAQNTRISFKKHFLKEQNFIQERNWDYENLSINSKNKDKNPKSILEKIFLKFDVNNEFNYRGFLAYLLRTQDDFQDVFKPKKFQGNHKDWKPILFQLLGFNASLLKEKYEFDDEIADLKKDIKKLQNQNTSNNEMYKIKAAIDAKEIEKQEIQKRVDHFDFYQKEKNISFDLVRNIENEISSLNNRRYILIHNTEQIQRSLESQNKPSLQLSDIKELFEEVKIHFPNNLSKTYEEVLNFSSQITKEREKYLKEELVDLKEELKQVSQKLKLLNQERAEMLSFIKEKDTFVKYKKYQEELIKIENEIYSYHQMLNEAKTVENYQKSIDNISNEIKSLSYSIKSEIDKENINYQKIREIFRIIYKRTFEFTALLFVQPNKFGNVNFETSVLNLDQNLTGKGDGYTSTKILCASFVLAILIHYSSNSFFRFAYHDGLLESWGDNHKIHFIKLLRNFCEEYQIQYIISLIKSDIPTNFELRDSEIVRTLGKKDLLFGFEF